MALDGVTAHKLPSLEYQVASGTNRLQTSEVVSGNGLPTTIVGCSGVLDVNQEQMLQGNLFSITGAVNLQAAGEYLFALRAGRPSQITAEVTGIGESKFYMFNISSVDASSAGTAVAPINYSVPNSVASVNSFRSAVSLADTGGILHAGWKSGGLDIGFKNKFQVNSGIDYGLALVSAVASNTLNYDFKWTE